MMPSRERSAGSMAASRWCSRVLLAAGLLGVPAAVFCGQATGSGAARRHLPTGAAGTRPDLRWPLEGSPAIVSSFGEYRYDHMHAGIDLSTGGATGLKVRAAADGTIARLKVEWRGYGRALYLRHADGRTTVYAHLERYEDATLGLERMVARRQAAAGTRYPGDIFLDPAIPVRRGQVIAYSGDSGVGPPHLHFEVRGADDQPLDPFRAGLRAPDDHRPPVLESVTITAADAGTYIDGVLRERTYPLERRGAQVQGREPVLLTGPFHATLSAYDPIPGGRVGIRLLEVLVDGRRVYRLDFDAFRFDQYPLSGLIHDHRFSHLGPTRFGYRLLRVPGNALATGPEAGDPDGDARAGSFDLDEGEHRLDLKVRDSAGVESRARLCVIVGRPGRLAGARRVSPDEADRPGSVARFDPLGEAAAGAGPRAARVEGFCPPDADGVEGEVWSEKEREFRPLDCHPKEGVCLSRAPLATGGPRPPLRLRRVAGGVPGPWQSVPEMAPAAADALRLEVDLLSSFIELKLPIEALDDATAPGDDRCPAPGDASWPLRDGLEIGSGVGYERAEALAAADPAGSECLLRHALGGLALRYVGPRDAARLEGDGFRIDMPAGARFYPGPLAARRVPAADLPQGLRPIGSAVDVLPAGEALNARATLSFDLGAVTDDTRALGIFRFDPVTMQWAFEGDAVETEDRVISLPFRRYGRFALLRDESPPIVIDVRPRAGAVGPWSEIVARVDEVGKGLGPDGVSFVLDGTALDSEFDPDRGTARPLAAPVLKAGPHLLRVVATDRAGNVSAPVEARFTVR